MQTLLIPIFIKIYTGYSWQRLNKFLCAGGRPRLRLFNSTTLAKACSFRLFYFVSLTEHVPSQLKESSAIFRSLFLLSPHVRIKVEVSKYFRSRFVLNLEEFDAWIPGSLCTRIVDLFDDDVEQILDQTEDGRDNAGQRKEVAKRLIVDPG